MKKLIKIGLLAVFFVMASCTTDADDDSDDWNAAEVCPENGTNAYGMPNRGTFVDERDGRVYKYTTIGDQVWMAENLKYEAENSECYTEMDNYCEIFGRFYNFIVKENYEYSGKTDLSLMDSVCPNGWHVPSMDEWKFLIDKMGGDSEQAVFRLNGRFYWGMDQKMGSDECFFNIIPSGRFNGSLHSIFDYAEFAIRYVDSKGNGYKIGFGTGIFFESNNSYELMVRCIRD